MSHTSDQPVELGDDFDIFVAARRHTLRRVLVAHYGVDVGIEATADALAYAWEHWIEIRGMANPAGYLYRVAQTSVRRQRRWQRDLTLPPERPTVRLAHHRDGDLASALARLSTNQRVAVLMIHAYGWPYADAAEVMDISVAALTNHVHRGMKRLRALLGDRDEDEA